MRLSSGHATNPSVFAFVTALLLSLCFAGPLAPLPDESSDREKGAFTGNALLARQDASTELIEYPTIQRTKNQETRALNPRGLADDFGNTTHIIWRSFGLVADSSSQSASTALAKLYTTLIDFLNDPVAVEQARVLTGRLFIGMVTLQILFQPVADDRRDVAATIGRFAQGMMRLLARGVVYGTYHLSVLMLTGTLWVTLWVRQNGGQAVIGRDVNGVEGRRLLGAN